MEFECRERLAKNPHLFILVGNRPPKPLLPLDPI